MTSTSGPGISLMGEFTGLAYYAEVPGVVFDIQRVGPSTGLPTRTAQGDILTVAMLSHGDTKQIMLLPATVEECYTTAMDAFDLAERFQTLVFVLSDLDLGMNNWMSHDVRVPDKPLDRGKLLDTASLERMGGSSAATRTWTATASPTGRFPATACPRTSPAAPGTTTAGSTANVPTTTSTTSSGWRASSRPREQYVPQPVIDENPKARVGIIAYGTTHWAIVESRDQLARESGVRDRLPAAAGVPVHRRHRRLHQPPRSRLRGRAEP